MTRHALLICTLLAAACSGSAQKTTPKPAPRPVPKGPTMAEYRAEAGEALASLRAARFDEARKQAALVGKKRPNPYADLVLVVTRYKKTMHDLSAKVRKLASRFLRGKGLDHASLRGALTTTEQRLGDIALVLDRVTRHPEFSFDLCLACWEVDWNHNGFIDGNDRLMFQIERDAHGKFLPKDSPRRRPTFRFDHGDVQWAMAFIHFQRALMNAMLAYSWDEVNRLFSWKFDKTKPVNIPIIEPARVKAARQLIVTGLKHADLARKAYLAETDDEREWLPSPKQKDHPLPLPVDQALYTTWEHVVADLQRLVSGEEGLSVAELAQLGDHKWEVPPQGYVNVGKMLENPKGIVLDLSDVDKLQRSNPADVEKLLTMILGDTYISKMKPTQLIKRMSRMKSEIKRGEESLERKLRYLIWLN